MIFRETPLAGAFVIESEHLADDRGYFSRTYCAREFTAHGLDPRIAQASISFNRQKGTLRGLHFQAAPNQEAKTIRCVRGSVFDVVVDLRRDSHTFGRWYSAKLTAERNVAVHAPMGFAHGFITLEDDAIVEYLISEEYVPACARGIRFDDPSINVEWPMAPVVISSRDLELPRLHEVLE